MEPVQVCLYISGGVCIEKSIRGGGGGGSELSDQLLDPDVPILASQDKLKVSPKGLPFVTKLHKQEPMEPCLWFYGLHGDLTRCYLPNESTSEEKQAISQASHDLQFDQSHLGIFNAALASAIPRIPACCAYVHIVATNHMVSLWASLDPPPTRGGPSALHDVRCKVWSIRTPVGALYEGALRWSRAKARPCRSDKSQAAGCSLHGHFLLFFRSTGFFHVRGAGMRFPLPYAFVSRNWHLVCRRHHGLPLKIDESS